MGDGYKVRRCEGEVLIALVSVLDIIPLAIIRLLARLIEIIYIILYKEEA